MTVRPQLLNGDEVAQLLVQHYPPLVRDACTGGTVDVWFFIDKTTPVLMEVNLGQEPEGEE